MVRSEYRVKNISSGAVITEFWGNEPVRKYKYRSKYIGGDILVWMSENERYKISEKTNFSAMNRWLSL